MYHQKQMANESKTAIMCPLFTHTMFLTNSLQCSSVRLQEDESVNEKSAV